MKRFGNARFAGSNALKRYKTSRYGVLIGHHRSTPLLDNSPSHLLLVAPTRAGKGVNYVVPNALLWPGNLIVLDPKGEVRRKTADFRSRYQRIITWSPSYARDGWDYLYACRSHDNQEAANTLAAAFLPKDDDYWSQAARELLSAVIALVGRYPRSTMGHVLAVLQELAPDRLPPLGDCPSSRMVRAHLAKAPAERSGVQSSALAAIRSFTEPLVARFCAPEVSPDDIQQAETTFYITASPRDFTTHPQLLGATLSQIAVACTTAGTARHTPTLWLLDEAAFLGSLPALHMLLSFSAGYNQRIALVYQSLGQIPEDMRLAVLSNTYLQCFLGVNDMETAELVSKRSGTMTIRQRSRSRSSGSQSSSTSVSTSEADRPLLLPQEVIGLGSKHAIVIAREQVIKARMRPYYQWPVLAGLTGDNEEPCRYDMELTPSPVPMAPPQVASAQERSETSPLMSDAETDPSTLLDELEALL